MLIADSDGKVSKRTMSSLTSGKTTVTDNNAFTSFPIIFHDESDGLLDDTGAFEYIPGSATFLMQRSGGGTIDLSETGDTANDFHIHMRNTKGGAAGDDNDGLGTIKFYGKNDAGSPETIEYGNIRAYIADATDGQEAGRIELNVTEYDGTLTTGLKLDGDTNVDGEIDVTIGAGVASITTIAALSYGDV